MEYRLGDWIEMECDGKSELGLVAQVGPGVVALIDPFDGNRITDPVEDGHSLGRVPEEVVKRLVPDYADWWKKVSPREAMKIMDEWYPVEGGKNES